MIAGMISSPNNYSPIRHPQRAKKRRDIGLFRLEKTGVITEREREAYEKKDLQLKVEDFAKRYPWFVTQAIGHIPDEYLEVGLQNKSIYSTIHPTFLLDLNFLGNHQKLTCFYILYQK